MKQGIKASNCIGYNIRLARKVNKMTQEQLVAKLQMLDCVMSRGTLAKIEVGIRHISVEELESIRKVLSMEYKDFFNKYVD